MEEVVTVASISTLPPENVDNQALIAYVNYAFLTAPDLRLYGYIEVIEDDAIILINQMEGFSRLYNAH